MIDSSYCVNDPDCHADNTNQHRSHPFQQNIEKLKGENTMQYWDLEKIKKVVLNAHTFVLAKL